MVRGHLGIVRHLVQKQAKLDLTDADQRTPLIKAVVSGNKNPQLNYEICRALMEGGAGDCKYIVSVFRTIDFILLKISD